MGKIHLPQSQIYQKGPGHRFPWSFQWSKSPKRPSSELPPHGSELALTLSGSPSRRKKLLTSSHSVNVIIWNLPKPTRQPLAPALIDRLVEKQTPAHLQLKKTNKQEQGRKNNAEAEKKNTLLAVGVSF